jgi:hypothetical protein
MRPQTEDAYQLLHQGAIALVPLDLKTRMNRAIRCEGVCQRRLDKIREAVAVYLAGDSTRKQLERVYHDTDPNYKAGE